MITGAGVMPDDEIAGLLLEMIHDQHRSGNDHYVEALTLAADAIQWQPLLHAPRDGTNVLLAVAPILAFGTPGFITVGRWTVPSPEELADPALLGRTKRERVERSGGWWTASKHRRPFRRAVLGWRPLPRFNFEAAGYIPDEVATING